MYRKDLVWPTYGDRISRLQASGARIQIVNAGVRKEITSREVVCTRDGSEDDGIEIDRSNNVLARTGSKNT